jgi:dCTP deaminase
MLQNDHWIKELATNDKMIVPFTECMVRKSYTETAQLPGTPCNAVPLSILSYGCGSYGYDIRLSPKEFKIFQHIPGTVINPKAFNPQNLHDAEVHVDRWGKFVILPAHSYGLGVALEHLIVPRNVTVLCLGKSTYARCGVILNTTPAEAGWRGHLTLEFSNSSSADCRLYLNEGIGQLLFFESVPCDTSYDDRKGKYQDQDHRITLPVVS